MENRAPLIYESILGVCGSFIFHPHIQKMIGLTLLNIIEEDVNKP